MILNGKMINPGELRTPINIGRRVVASSTGGFSPVSYTAFARVWSRWTNVHGSEVWQARAEQAEEPATVLVRYHPELDATCAVEKGGRWYEIVSIDDIQERHEFMELKVRLGKAG